MNLHRIEIPTTHNWSGKRYSDGWERIQARNEAPLLDGDCYGYIGMHYCIAAFDNGHRSDSNPCKCTHHRCGLTLNTAEHRRVRQARA